MKPSALLLTVATWLMATIVPIARAEITSEQVREALANGARYLKSKQRDDGSWPPVPGYPGGVTSLCTLALLHSGEGPEGADVQRALNWLRRQRLDKTYTVSLQTMVFCKAEPAKDLLLIQRNAEWLEQTQIADGPYRGGWTYPAGLVGATGDNSNSQFAVLALGEAEQAGATINERTWRLAKAYWQSGQNPDGSWGYKKRMGIVQFPGTGSMTCAGIASMVIIEDATGQTDAAVVDGKIRCCRGHRDEDGSIERGMAWLARNFSVARNPGASGGQWGLYYLYAVERVGRMTAQRFIGRHDWYREGADYLLRWDRNVLPDGQIVVPDHWTGGYSAEQNELIATSLAMLFLSKGRRPVLLSKAERSPGDDWNQHQHDAANLTRYVESKWKHDMTWQVVDLDLAGIDDLIQSPVLYLSGSRDPCPRGEEARRQLARKLRGYLDRGGFLLAEATCGGRGFDEGFRKLMEQVFPEREYRLALLDAAHPIWRAEEPIRPAYLRPLLGIDFGCRTSVVYAPPDPPDHPRPSLSCLWELSRPGRGTKYPDAVQAEIDAGRALGINILAYATNRELRYKDEIPAVVSRPDDAPGAQRGRLAVARLRHPGGCNAAPRALVHLLEQAEDQLKVRAAAEDRLIGLGDEALFNYHLVFMQGRTAFRLTNNERKRLAEYVERGGMVMADAICSSPAFTESFRREMAAVFPGKPLARLASTDPLLTPVYGGYDLKTVTRNDPQTADVKGPIRAKKQKVAPALEGVRFGDRWGVIFSPYDISCALERHNSLECQGYTQEDAARIALNVLLYSLQQ
ncbi:MAG: DUF4159 domain-containing protein [Pirellulales bacterium]|nr:DUF4159 domain-containing protein [Pirellulales bacterium]